MSRFGTAVLAGLVVVAVANAQQSHVAEIRVHGNHSVDDEEIVRLSGVVMGEPVSANISPDAEKRLLESGLFSRVDVRVRFRQLDGAGDASVVVIVRERAPIAKRWMLGPVFDLSDEYGFTYGAQLALVDVLLEDLRVRIPMSWGGNRSAGIEAIIPIAPGRQSFRHQLELGLRRERSIHPHFDIADNRTEFTASLASRFKALRVGVTGRRSGVDFSVLSESFTELGGQVSLDTRHDRTIPGDAIYVELAVDHLVFGGEDGLDRPDVNRARLDLRGYKRLFGQSTLAAQVSYTTTDGPLPPYAQAILGGGRTLRGHDSGRFIGDRLALATLELRVPLTSTLALRRAGIHVFYDTGSAFEHTIELRKAKFHHGVGFGGFFRIAFVGVRVDLGFDLEGNTRLHFGSQFKF